MRGHLLEQLVALHDRRERPVAVAALADRLETDPATVRETLEPLHSSRLAEPREDGWVPTVTARELLDLDVDLDDPVVIELRDEKR